MYKIGVIGLGYVGLPLAVAFSKRYEVFGYDIDPSRIEALKNNNDETLELKKTDLKNLRNLSLGHEISVLKKCNIFIITVPTPVNKYLKPDLKPLKQASKSVSGILKKGDVVIYESTVYPGCTEEICVPILEKFSNLKYNKDFFCGYSPERVNPGDKKNKITNIKKITSGSNKSTAEKINKLYRSIITAGTYMAPNIKVAEAAKVIENTQRDANIALINECAIIFNRLGIDTHEVLEAAGTKWNFLPFKPGLVGGHCIGVDPYYLKYKAREMGYHPRIISAVRKLNDDMPRYIANEIIGGMERKKIKIKNSKILIMGVTFKENCPDIRNSKVFDIARILKKNQVEVNLFDPWASSELVRKKYNFEIISKPQIYKYDAIIMAVAHNEFMKFEIDELKGYCKNKHFIYDIKNILPKNSSDSRL